MIKQIGKGSYGAALLARLKIDRRVLRAIAPLLRLDTRNERKPNPAAINTPC